MASSWLFTRNDESVYLSRAGKFTMLVAGPGQRRQQLHFDDEPAVQEYQRQIADQMASSGWILYGVDQERRHREPGSAQTARQERRLRS
jgi:hypothetical protein